TYQLCLNGARVGTLPSFGMQLKLRGVQL
uniref:Predicted gene, 26741 n=1 Tax=Peromyscus maniculatus bairdii TaxID=230844 RepID=A0A8C8W547_PERMB